MTLLTDALQHVAEGPDALSSWLERHPEVSTSAFAKEVLDYAHSGLQQGSLNAAYTGYLLAGTIQMRLGDKEGALRSKIQETEVLFMSAKTAESYEATYSTARAIAEHAVDAEYSDLAFWSFGLAADSAYWGSDATLDEGTKKKWLRVAVEMLLRIDTPPAREVMPGPWERFVSSLVATYQTVTDEQWGSDQQAVAAELKRLAALVESVIPLDFTFDDPKKTEHVAHHLAALSAEHGSPKAAENRLRITQQSIKSDTWID